ncbi:hypothetical protein [Ornithinimicrobium murale]|uniref:hypothetical protein n=1 Tax=Ornithinimicrobium murale TaxID=1050153 RepID=UPI000E0D57E1|nr:hypothetical protein [Ornithinimicrobium murale]
MSTDTERLVHGQDPELEDLAELLHRAAGHPIFPAAKIVACSPCIEQARNLAPKLAEREAAAWDKGYRLACRDHGNYDTCATGDHGQQHCNPYLTKEGQS